MIIKIAGLGEGVHHFDFNESIAKIGLSEPFYGDFEVEADLTKSRGQIILDAEIKLKANFDCDRCSSNFNSVINSSYKMVYIFGNAPEDEDEGSNIKYLPPETDRINLTEELKDYSILAIPMKKLCKEDCKGLCPHCGKDLNEGNCGCVDKEIDARWLPLQDLKNKLKQ